VFDEEEDDVEEKPVAVEMDKPAHNWKDEEKADRWFAQGIFANVEKKEEEGESSEEDDIAEMDDKDVLKLPLTDKQRRQKLRKKNRSKNEKKKERSNRWF
jgi:hypothetical protein